MTDDGGTTTADLPAGSGWSERPVVQLFTAFWRARPGLTVTWWSLLVLGASLPSAFAVLTGRLAGLVAETGGTGLVPALVALGLCFLVMQVLPRLEEAVSMSLGSRLAAWLNERLVRASVAPAGLAHLEHPDLTITRDFDRGANGPPLYLAVDFVRGSLLQLLVGVASTVVLAWYSWWAALVLLSVWTSTHWLLRESSVWKDRDTAEVSLTRQHAEYAYELAVDPRPAKEIRLFGLDGWVVDRFAHRRRELYDAQYLATRLRERSIAQAAALVVAGNLLVFGLMGYLCLTGAWSLQHVVSAAQLSISVQWIAFGGLSWAVDDAAAAVVTVNRLAPLLGREGHLPTGARTLPTEPTNPPNHTEPTAPARPTEPTEPLPRTETADRTQPAEPHHHTDAADPTSPPHHTEPTEPPHHTETADRTEPAEPHHHTDAADPTSPPHPTEPTAPAAPAHRRSRDRRTEPTGPPEPTDPAHPTEAADPAEPTNPAHRTSRGSPTEPTDPPTPTRGSNRPQEPVTPTDPPTTQTAGVPTSTGAAVEVELRDLCFSYPHSHRPLYSGLNLRVPAGSSLAIVGANGAGKTSLAKLLCRFYDPTAGAVRVDGVDLRELDLDAWRSRIAAVFQDFVHFERSLRANVDPAGRCSDAEVLASLRDAGAGHLVDLDTPMAKGYPGGVELSGGQWQRVALARVLCGVRSGARLVILDEPTANLDVRGEATLFSRLLTETRGTTTILISHRFSTVRMADRIAVLVDGSVAEFGSHRELIRADGHYRRMFQLQASRFTADHSETGEQYDTLD